jgi:hypothetical protein
MYFTRLFLFQKMNAIEFLAVFAAVNGDFTKRLQPHLAAGQCGGSSAVHLGGPFRLVSAAGSAGGALYRVQALPVHDGLRILRLEPGAAVLLPHRELQGPQHPHYAAHCGLWNPLFSGTGNHVLGAHARFLLAATALAAAHIHAELREQQPPLSAAHRVGPAQGGCVFPRYRYLIHHCDIPKNNNP